MHAGEGQALALRFEGTLLGPVARGPVPRDASRCLKQDFQDYRIFRIISVVIGAAVFAKARFFRSFRSCMSIETHVGPFSSSVRT